MHEEEESKIVSGHRRCRSSLGGGEAGAVEERDTVRRNIENTNTQDSEPLRQVAFRRCVEEVILRKALNIRLLDHRVSYGFDEFSPRQQDLSQALLYEGERSSLGETMNEGLWVYRHTAQVCCCTPGRLRSTERPVGTSLATAESHKTETKALSRYLGEQRVIARDIRERNTE